MRTLILSAAYPPQPAGEADYTWHVARGLAARGMEIEVLTGATPSTSPRDGVRVHSGMGRWSWADLPRLVETLRSRRPDAILLNYLGWIYGHHPMVNYAPVLAKKILPESRFVTLFFNTTGADEGRASLGSVAWHYLWRSWSGNPRARFEFGSLLTSSDRIIALGDRHRRLLESAEPLAKNSVEVVPPFPLLEIAPGDGESHRRELRARHGIREDEFLFAYFGYVYPGKGLDTLIQAVQRLARKKRSVRLVNIGGVLDERYSNWSTYGDCLRHLAWALGVEDRLIWTGAFSHRSDEASRWLFAADGAVMPFDVGLGTNNSSVAATCRHGLPLVSTRGPQIDGPFVDGDNVVLCAPRDPEGLAAAMDRLMTDEALRAKVRRGTNRLYAELFSRDLALDRLDRILRGKPAQPAAVRSSAGAKRREWDVGQGRVEEAL